jgi:hypothetical protein
MLTPAAMQEVLLAAHLAEAERAGAKFHNFGWAADEAGMVSKTDKGILDSEVDPETDRVTHTWTA